MCAVGCQIKRVFFEIVKASKSTPLVLSSQDQAVLKSHNRLKPLDFQVLAVGPA